MEYEIIDIARTLSRKDTFDSLPTWIIIWTYQSKNHTSSPPYICFSQPQWFIFVLKLGRNKPQNGSKGETIRRTILVEHMD